MKEIIKSPELMMRAAESISHMYELMREMKQAIREFEEITLTLEGEVFGDLLVVEKVDRYKVQDNSEVYLPMWRCECDCGSEAIVSHLDLIENEVIQCDNCKGEEI